MLTFSNKIISGFEEGISYIKIYHISINNKNKNLFPMILKKN